MCVMEAPAAVTADDVVDDRAQVLVGRGIIVRPRRAAEAEIAETGAIDQTREREIAVVLNGLAETRRR